VAWQSQFHGVPGIEKSRLGPCAAWAVDLERNAEHVRYHSADPQRGLHRPAQDRRAPGGRVRGVRRGRDPDPRRPGGGAQAARHVHRRHVRRHGPAPSGVRGGGQLDRRGARGPLRRHRGHHPQRQLDQRHRQRPWHPDRHQDGRQARAQALGGRDRVDRAARGRQVQPEQLQGLGRPARRGRVVRERALEDAAPDGAARRQGPRARVQQGLRAEPHRRADRRRRGLADADPGRHRQARHRSALPARHRDLQGEQRFPLRNPLQAPARTLVPQQRRAHPPGRRAQRQERRFLGCRRRQGLRRLHQHRQAHPAPHRVPCHGRAPGRHLRRHRGHQHRRRGRDAVERRLQRERAVLHQQHPAARRRHPPDRAARGDDARDQQVHRRERIRQEGQGRDQRRRHARRPDLRAVGQGTRAQVLQSTTTCRSVPTTPRSSAARSSRPRRRAKPPARRAR